MHYDKVFFQRVDSVFISNVYTELKHIFSDTFPPTLAVSNMEKLCAQMYVYLGPAQAWTFLTIVINTGWTGDLPETCRVLKNVL